MHLFSKTSITSSRTKKKSTSSNVYCAYHMNLKCPVEPQKKPAAQSISHEQYRQSISLALASDNAPKERLSPPPLPPTNAAWALEKSPIFHLPHDAISFMHKHSRQTNHTYAHTAGGLLKPHPGALSRRGHSARDNLGATTRITQVITPKDALSRASILVVMRARVRPPPS